MPIELGSFSLGAVAGTAVGAVFGHFLTKSRDKESRKFKSFNEAAQVFREAFTPELTLAQATYKQGVEIFYFLSDAFSRQESAVITFKQHLKAGEVSRFETAWADYCYPEGNPEEAPEPFCDYISEGNIEAEKAVRKLAVEKISNLLAFAKLK